MAVETAPVLFSGSIPFNYDNYLAPLFFAPFAKDLVQRVRRFQPASLLELACGSGRVSIYWPHVLSRNARIVVSDISADMVTYASKKIGHSNRINWKVIDAADLPFGKGSFDCIAAQFGATFYPDRARAFTEAFRVLKPQGTLLMNTWDELKYNPVAQLAHEAIMKYFGPETPPLFKIPFAYHQDEKIRSELSLAGFRNIAIDVVAMEGYSNNAQEAVTGLIDGTPAGQEIMNRNREFYGPVKEELEKLLRQNFGSSNLKVPLQAKVISAEA